MNATFAAPPPLHPDTRLTVTIPARDEERRLPAALAALARQRDPSGLPLPARSFDVLLFANGCRDGTAAVARAFARSEGAFALWVVEGDLPHAAAHVGTARRALMDAAAERFERAGRPRGIIASTDADSIVDPLWVAATLADVRAVDAVTGRILLARENVDALARATRALYLRDVAYHRLVGELEALRDPVPHDPLPRHGQHFGASFAVTTEAYRRAGGLPPLPALEDVAFYRALQRVDARVRHSMRVRVTTSARTLARVHGGFASHLEGLAARSDGGEGMRVEHPAYTLARIDARAALRRLWSGGGSSDDLDRVTATYDVSRYRFRRLFDPAATFGENAHRLETSCGQAFANPPTAPVSVALAALRCARASANAVRPKRCTAASGAG